MFCRIAMDISPPWLALPDAEGVTLRVTLSGSANVTRGTAAEVCSCASPRPRRIADQPGAKTVRQWKFHNEGCELRGQDGRRLLPPEGLRIVPQPRRERPPIWPRVSAQRAVRGGRSRLGCLSRLCHETGSRFAPHMPRERAPKCRRPSPRNQLRSWAGFPGPFNQHGA
jgi:hypothetical protein